VAERRRRGAIYRPEAAVQREQLLEDLPFAKPMGYGLAKHGWVSLKPADDQLPSLKDLKNWVDESDRAVAPKILSKRAPTLD